MNDLQILMMQILEEKGVSLEKGDVNISDSSIEVTKTFDSETSYHSKTDMVSVDLAQEMIRIDSYSHDKDDIHPWAPGSDETEWFDMARSTQETYQIKNGKMNYKKISTFDASKTDSMGGGVPGSNDYKEISEEYELPEGYKITDGISVFTNGKASKVARR